MQSVTVTLSPERPIYNLRLLLRWREHSVRGALCMHKGWPLPWCCTESRTSSCVRKQLVYILYIFLRSNQGAIRVPLCIAGYYGVWWPGTILVQRVVIY